MNKEKAQNGPVHAGGEDVEKTAAHGPIIIAAQAGESADETLMQRVAAGDLAAMEQLYDRHSRRLYNYYLRRLGSVERAEELTHDVFLALLGLRRRYRVTAPFVALLYGIARKLLFKEYRRMKRKGPTPLDVAAAGGAAGWTEEGFAVRQALGRLPERLLEPLMLRVYEQLSYEEIAATIKRPIGTVRSRIARAKRTLAQLLATKEQA